MGKPKRKKELNIQTKVVKEQPPRTQDVREQSLLAFQNQTKGEKMTIKNKQTKNMYSQEKIEKLKHNNSHVKNKMKDKIKNHLCYF